MNSELVELFRELMREGRVQVFDPQHPQRPDYIVGSRYAHVPGSRAALCVGCASTVYLSDSIAILSFFDDVPIVCVECAARHAEQEGG
jgi:hypothetical protein